MEYDGSIRINTEIDIKELKRQAQQAEREFKRLSKSKASLVDKKELSEENLTRSTLKSDEIISKYTTTSEYKKFLQKATMQQEAGSLSKEDFYKQKEAFLLKNAEGYASATKEVNKYAKEVEKYEDLIDTANRNINTAQQAMAASQTRLAEAQGRTSTNVLSRILQRLKSDYEDTEKSGHGFFSMLKKEKNPVKELGNSIFTLGKMFKLLAVRMALRKVLNLVITGFKNLAEYSANFNTTMSSYQSNMQYLGNALSTSLAPILTALLPLFDQITEAIVRAINAVAAFTSRLFGLSNTYIRAKKAQTDFANSSKKATDKQLASFDTINKLSKSSSSSSSGAGGMFEEVAIPQETINNAEKFRATIQPTIDALRRLQEALGAFGETIWSGLSWGYDNVLVPLGAWVFSNALPLFLDILTESVKLLDAALKALGPAVVWLWDNLLSPALQVVGNVIIEILKSIKDTLIDLNQWAEDNPEMFQAIIVALTGLLFILLAIKVPILGVIALGLLLIAAFDDMGATTELLVVILGTLAIALLATTSPIMAVIAAIALIVYAIMNWEEVWKGIVAVASSVWEAIVDIWKGVANWFETKIFTPVKNGFKKFVNGLINYFENFVNGLIKGINWIIDALNRALSFDIPDWVPIIGGSSWSIGIPNVRQISIPRLATGTVVSPNNPFMAMLGDNKQEQEIVSPLSTMKQALQEVLAESGMSRNITVVMEYNGREFGRAVYEANNKETQRIGLKLAKGGKF
jgi:hypothetical protein